MNRPDKLTEILALTREPFPASRKRWIAGSRPDLRVPVREVADFPQALAQPVGGRRDEDHFVIPRVFHADVLVRTAQATRSGGVVEGALGQQNLKIEEHPL